jgi:hypothetical protein
VENGGPETPAEFSPDFDIGQPAAEAAAGSSVIANLRATKNINLLNASCAHEQGASAFLACAAVNLRYQLRMLMSEPARGYSYREF